LTSGAFRSQVAAAGEAGKPLEIDVLRVVDGQEHTVELPAIVPNFSIGDGRRGLGIGLGHDDDHAVVGGLVENSAAAKAQVPVGSRIVRVNDQPVQSWHDVFALLRDATPERPVRVVASLDGHEQTYTLSMDAREVAQLQANRYVVSLGYLKPHVEPRRTDSVLTAAWWGVTETRDMIVQFYLTIRRMIGGSVSAKNLSGPVGIVHTGSLLAWRGGDWLLWFLAMISANLAVVNFLPIPIVDGGLFTFLVLEKLTGKPPSPRTQSVAQLIGLTLIVGLFLFVTYNDIMRLL
jgi:regulator of sigma E protease